MKKMTTVSNFSKKKLDENKIKMKIDWDMLNHILLFTIDIYNPYRTKKTLRNIKKLFEIIDTDVYNENPEEETLFKSIYHVLTDIVDNQIQTVEILANNVYEDIYEAKDMLKESFDDMIDITYEEECGQEEDISKYVCKFVEDKLTFYNIYKCRDLLEPLFEKIDTVKSLSLINDNYTKIIQKVYKECMNCKMDRESAVNDFDLYDDSRTDFILNNAIEEYQRPDSRIKLGIKWLNDLFNGGLENGRFYLACGLPKSFKSGLLLNIVLWSIKYNTFDLKDENKVPAVFYLTMENSVRETINRLYINLFGKSLANYSYADARKILNEEIKEKYGINLVIKYRPNKSISTLDFDNMISDIEADGYEVVIAIQDYTKRIRSSSPNQDLRLELGAVSDDFCSIAKQRNIPIVSAAQFNRNAMSEVEKALAKGKKDIIKELNAAHIGESAMLIENADCSFAIYKEVVKETDEEYLSFKLIASRDEEPKITSFSQKFENGMKLEEDFDLNKTLSVENIAGTVLNNFNPNIARKKAAQKNSSVVVDDDNIDVEFEEVSEDDLDENDIIKPKKRKKKSRRNVATKSKNIKKEDENLLDEDDDIDFDDEED